MRKLFICKWVGNYSLLTFILLLSFQSFAQSSASGNSSSTGGVQKARENGWASYENLLQKNMEEDCTNGMSYIISGGIALLGGIIGGQVTADPLERGVYSLFQTIGVASIGYGAFKWKVGDEQRLFIRSLSINNDLSDSQKLSVMRNFLDEKKKSEIQERKIRAITHGLIALLNFYNGSQQKQEGVRSTLYFIGGANALAMISYTF